MRTKNKPIFAAAGLILSLLLALVAALCANEYTVARAEGEESIDIAPYVRMLDFKETWSTDTTQIIITIGENPIVQGLTSNAIFGTEYLNNHQGELSNYLEDYILIDGKPLKEIIGTSDLRGTKFPMGADTIYNPVCVKPSNHDINIYILKEWKAHGTFEVRFKKGFTLQAEGKTVTLGKDIVYGYASNGAWTRKHDVTFMCDGEVLETQTVVDGLQPTAPANVTKESTATTDYTFIGWDKAISATKDHTVYTAQFTESAREYAVTYYGEDGETEIKSERVANGAKLTEPANPNKEPTNEYEYEFDGWYNGETKWDFEQNVMPAADLTLTAKFTASERKYRVHFLDDEGNAYADEAFATLALSYNAVATEPTETPVKQATAAQTFKFIGWFNGETKFDFATPVTQDISLRAKFEASPREYTVTFEIEGDLELRPDGLPEKVTVHIGEKLTLGDYSVLDYTYKIFSGETEITETELTVTHDITLRVVYTAVPEEPPQPTPTPEVPAENDDGKGCGSFAGQDYAAVGAVLLLALAAVLLRRASCVRR
ncbi:MAG: InlB B-repeat-containing protein [Clostridia bacterium]|nr:InlB B-repeat-containing protein [Clostridia bacterium]